MITVTDLFAGAGGATTYRPIRVQRRHTKGWRTPLCGCGCGEPARYVGRPTLWGNPFQPGILTLVNCPSPSHPTEPVRHRITPTSHTETVALYRAVITDPLWWLDQNQPPDIETIQRNLRGHDLACWCPPGLPCHADVLLAIANREALSWDG